MLNFLIELKNIIYYYSYDNFFEFLDINDIIWILIVLYLKSN